MTRPFIVEVIRPFRRQAAVVAVLVLLDTLLTSLGVGVVLPVFQALLDPQHQSAMLTDRLPFLGTLTPGRRLAVLAGGTVVVFLTKAIIAYFAFAASHEFVQRLRFHWVSRIGEHFLYGPHLQIVGRKQGELLNDWFNETYAASRYVHAYTTLFASSVLTFMLFTLGAFIDWRVTLVLFGFGVLAVLIVRKRLFGGAARLSAEKIVSLQGITSSMLENIANIRDIKLMRAEAPRLAHLSAQTRGLKSILVRGAVAAESPKIVGEFMAVFTIMAVVVVAALVLAAQPQTVVPMLAFVFVLFHRLFTAASLWMSARTRALNDVHSAELVHRLASRSVEYEDRDHGLPLERIESDIRLEAISFSYADGRVALSDVHAVIPQGALTFLLGPSGAGKSTLLDLLLRLIEPTSGRIVVNNRAASEFNLAQWRRCFGYVSQDVTLFNGTVSMNLMLARPEATRNEIVEACRLAGADEFIAQLPLGYDTIVGDRGHSLSGGQRKRIAIARALINRPSVLILDEATSAFEQDLERKILRSIVHAMPALTIIQVTHRPQAAVDGDWVIALDKGAVRVAGPSSEVGSRVVASWA